MKGQENSGVISNMWGGAKREGCKEADRWKNGWMDGWMDG
jgi:hypothetical protein